MIGNGMTPRTFNIRKSTSSSISVAENLQKLERHLAKSNIQYQKKSEKSKKINESDNYKHLTNFDEIIKEFRKFGDSRRLVCKQCQEKPREPRERKQNDPRIALYKDLLSRSSQKRIEEERIRQEAIEEAKRKRQKYLK